MWSRTAVALLGGLALVAASPAFAAPGSTVTGPVSAEKDTGAALNAVGIVGDELLPLKTLDTTNLIPCPAAGKCVAGPFAVKSTLTFGVLPIYQGSVTFTLRGPGGPRPLFTCEMPGMCPVIATGAASPGTLSIVGLAAPGSVGEYVMWVSFE